jgi:hypothetical protein
MTSATADPWTRNWTIVSADLDVAHVMLPLSNFRLDNLSNGGNAPVYRVTHNAGPPAPDYFSGALLRPSGANAPSFFDITKMGQLPLYTQETASQYADVSDLMGTYLAQNTAVRRLEGQIRIPCHPAGGQPPPDTLPGHSPQTITTLVHLYQFDNAVTGGRPLLVVHTPLSPTCPTNGDGTAIGMGKD